MSKALVCLLLALACAVHAETVTGRVVSVADGDTITMLGADKIQHKIRLAGIDAPEKKQPFGQRSKESLSDLVFDKTVTVNTEKLDKYRRNVGKVLVDGVDANLEQLKRGMAWHYKAYQREQSLDDRLAYAAAEKESAASHIGLWQDTEPVPPWVFRHPAKAAP
jgi:endonuclease YncB( thermonuclease family)